MHYFLNTLKCSPKNRTHTQKKVEAQNILYYSRHSEVRPLTWNYEAVLLVGKFPHLFSLRFLVYPSLLKSRINHPIEMTEYLPEIPFNLTQGLCLCMGTCGNRFSWGNRPYQELFNIVALLQTSTQPQQRQNWENKQNETSERAAQCLARFFLVIERLTLSKGIEMVMR